MTKIKVRFKGYNPNSGYGFYQAGDVGTVVGYTQGLAVVVKEDGTFVKAELSHIVEMEEDVPPEIQQVINDYFDEMLDNEPIGVPVEKVKLATKQDTSELTEFEEAMGNEIFDPPFNREHIAVIKSVSQKLLSIARKQLQPEFDKELELAYKNQDKVVYNRGYDKGREDERKEKVDDLISKDDIEQLVGEYEDEGHFRDLVLAYKQGIERVVEFIKEK